MWIIREKPSLPVDIPYPAAEFLLSGCCPGTCFRAGEPDYLKILEKSQEVIHKIQRFYPHVDNCLWKTLEAVYFVAKTDLFRTK